MSRLRHHGDVGAPRRALVAACFGMALAGTGLARTEGPGRKDTLSVGVMKRANRVVGNVMIVKDRRTLPADDPIAWRETAKKSLGKVHYLFRILVVIEVPVAFISVIVLLQGRRGGGELLPALVFIVWAISVLAVSVTSANTVASERTSQTLEVLLTTPITGRDIVLQKMRAVRRLMYVFLVPFFTLFVTEAWWEHATGSYGYGYGDGKYTLGTFGYLVSSSLSVFIFLPMYSWFGMWMGLRSKTRTRAILGTLGGVVAWSVLPVAVAVMFGVLWDPHGDMWVYLTLFGPTTMKFLTEFGNEGGAFRAFHTHPVVPIFLAYVWHAGLFAGLRHWSLRDADRYLGRVQSEHAKEWQWLRSARGWHVEASRERSGARKRT